MSPPRKIFLVQYPNKLQTIFMGHSGRPGRSKEKPLENLMFKLKKLPIYQDIGNLFKLSLNFWRTFYLENKS